MKRFVFSRKMCYSYKKIMKDRIKKGIVYFLSATAALAVVASVTLITVKQLQPHGQGGFEEVSLPELTDDILDQQLMQEAVADETTDVSEKDFSLSYFSYRVKPGDMLGFIADRFDLTSDTLISVNQIKQSRLIQSGQYLKIPSMSGILYTVKVADETPQSIADKYEVDAEKCALVNNINVSQSLPAGTTLFVPDAHLDWVTRQEINGDLFIKPIHSRYYLSSVYGYRQNPFDASKRTYHNGMDLACSQGTYVYAALSGKITTTGYNDVYGNYIIITHHSGYKTLYGHLSSVLCKKGQYVTTDTKIGRVGSTGMSTGPHLHFTVYKNGKTVNPANLWK